MQDDDHLLTVCRYVERNPVPARLVRRVEAWRWGSLRRRERGRGLDLLADGPAPGWRRFAPAAAGRTQTP